MHWRRSLAEISPSSASLFSLSGLLSARVVSSYKSWDLLVFARPGLVSIFPLIEELLFARRCRSRILIILRPWSFLGMKARTLESKFVMVFVCRDLLIFSNTSLASPAEYMRSPAKPSLIRMWPLGLNLLFPPLVYYLIKSSRISEGSKSMCWIVDGSTLLRKSALTSEVLESMFKMTFGSCEIIY